MAPVTVIIPVFNRAELLRVTLQNVLAQSTPPTQIIVVDDGSADGSAAVAESFGYPVVVLQNIGKGPGAARNLGLKYATQPFIQFFDSDDLMTSGKLEAQVKEMVSTGADMVYGPYVMATALDDGQWRQDDVIMQAKPLPNNDLLKWMLRGWNAITQACLFRRSFLDNCPAWDEDLITHEDYLFLTRMAMHRPNVAHVGSEGVLYRQHGLQSTADATKQLTKAKEKCKAMELIKTEIRSKKIDWLTRVLFDARKLKDETYLLDLQGIEEKEQMDEKILKIVYRTYNKFERWKSGSAWETMHGIDCKRASFEKICRKIV